MTNKAPIPLSVTIESTPEQIQGSELYPIAGFLAEHTDAGLRLFAPKAGVLNAAGISALTIGVEQSDRRPSLAVLTADTHYPERAPYVMKYEMASGSSGGSNNPATAEKLRRLESKSLTEQLLMAGFHPVEGQNPSQQLFRWEDSSPNDEGKASEILAQVTTGEDGTERITNFFEPIQDFGMGDLIGKSQIVDATTTVTNWRHEEVPVLRLATDAFEYSINPDWTTAPQNVKQTREMTAEELDVQPLPEHVETTGFVIGGSNDTQLIRELPTITGIPIAELTEKMRPDRLSEAGFLGEDDGLLATLARDNDVVQQARLTHRDLAEPLKMVAALVKLGIHAGEQLIYGQRYQVKSMGTMGVQESPFNDGLGGSMDYIITNVDTGASVSTSALGMRLIERYGFYEGPGTPYRSAPEDIIRTFAHLQDRAKLV